MKSFLQVICRHGCPSVLITDQGREFVNKLSDELCAITGTEHRITSAYHPQVYSPQFNFCLENIVDNTHFTLYSSSHLITVHLKTC